MRSYKLSKKAADEIADIFIYSLEEFGLKQADTYHNGLTNTFEFLAKYPQAARLRSEISPPVRVHRYEAHMIIYEQEDDNIIILRVRHSREDWNNASD